MDHIAGLFPFLCLRQSTKGDTEKPLAIYYPEGDRSIERFRLALNEMLGSFVKYPISWQALNPGDRIELKKGRYMTAHQADHGTENPLLYVISEERNRLKKDLHGQPGQELAKLSDEEKYDYHKANIFAYSGDSMPVDPGIYTEADILIHECTFLSMADRKYPIHSEIQEVFDLAKEARVKQLYLTHISPRYFPKKIPGLISKAESHGISFDYFAPNRVSIFE